MLHILMEAVKLAEIWGEFDNEPVQNYQYKDNNVYYKV